MTPRNPILTAALVLSLSGAAKPAAGASVSDSTEGMAHPSADIPRPLIEIRKDADGRQRFHLDGEVFPLYGAGGAEAPGLLEQLKAAGGNVVRTWGIETLARTYEDGERYLDRAHRLGLKVIPGIWVEHERHGFDYGNPDVIEQQRTRVVEAVRTYRDHPAIIAWGIGNEMEGPSDPEGSIPVLKEVEQLIRLVKAEDPTRPVMTVIAYHPAKVKNLIEHVPGIDFLGVNSYGGAAGAGSGLKAAGWTKPFAVTEFGVRGFWEVDTTPWGAPYEPTSQEKARTYYATQRMVFEVGEGSERCLGTFAFLWGWKQERTATWFGMFLPTLEKLPQVDAMTKVWTGRWPANRAPVIRKLSSGAYGKIISPGNPVEANLDVDDPDGDALRYAWEISAESTAKSEGGDAEDVPRTFPGLIKEGSGPRCVFTSPSEPGNYRLFVTVHDGQGSAATANFPFRVER